MFYTHLRFTSLVCRHYKDSEHRSIALCFFKGLYNSICRLLSLQVAKESRSHKLPLKLILATLVYTLPVCQLSLTNIQLRTTCQHRLYAFVTCMKVVKYGYFDLLEPSEGGTRIIAVVALSARIPAEASRPERAALLEQIRRRCLF